MDFSKYKLQKYLTEFNNPNDAKEIRDTTTQGARDGAAKASERQGLNKGQQSKQNSQAVGTAQSSKTRFPESMDYNKQLIKEKEVIRAIESNRSDWRSELQEKVVDGLEREKHPYVTVMPTGDENLLQAVEQMMKTAKKKKEDVTEETLEEEKKCKKGYEKKDGKCVKKKKSSKSRTTIYVGARPMYGGFYHHHHDDDEGDNDGGGNGGGESGGGGDGGGGGGMGEMLDLLGDMLLSEMTAAEKNKASTIDDAKTTKERQTGYAQNIRKQQEEKKKKRGADL